eukprot:451729-Rhodomonas_salina.1
MVFVSTGALFVSTRAGHGGGFRQHWASHGTKVERSFTWVVGRGREAVGGWGMSFGLVHQTPVSVPACLSSTPMSV